MCIYYYGPQWWKCILAVLRTIKYFYLWSTVGELWLLDDSVSLWGFAPRLQRTLRDRSELGSLSGDFIGRGCVYDYVLM